MRMKNNPGTNYFIQDILLADKDQGEIVLALRKIILKIVPSAKEEKKYGGLVFMSGTRLFCGLFVRENYISLEFDKGAKMQDPDNFLEGSGKYRRHLKIFKPEDIKHKKAEYYIKQNDLT